MAAMDTTTLENTTDIRQWVSFASEGEEAATYDLPPYGVLDFPAEVAREFLLRRPRFVRPYEPVTLPDPEPGEPLVFIANMTGSPFLPGEITLALIQRGGKMSDEKIPNPLRNPMTVKCEMQGGQVIQPCRNDPTTKESLNLPPTKIEIPPFRRFRVGMTLADWLIKRDAAQLPGLSGALQQVDGPRDYEAQQDWRLYSLQAYGMRLDPNTFHVDDPIFGAAMRAAEEDYETSKELRDARLLLWRGIWFRALDSRFGNPNHAEHRQLQNQLLRKRGLDPDKYKKSLEMNIPSRGVKAPKLEGGGKAKR